MGQTAKYLLCLIATTYLFLPANSQFGLDFGNYYSSESEREVLRSAGLEQEKLGDPVGGRTFYAITSRRGMTFEQAQKACKELGYKLASVRSKAEWNHLMEFPKGNIAFGGAVWTGGKQRISPLNTDFEWVEDGIYAHPAEFQSKGSYGSLCLSFWVGDKQKERYLVPYHCESNAPLNALCMQS